MGLTYAEADRCGIAHLWPADLPKSAVLHVKESNKYGSIRTEYNGVWYASKAEARRAHELDLGKLAGIVLSWTGQPRFRLGCHENVYVADFNVIGPDGRRVEDTKGFATAKFKRDLKLWRKYGECDLWIIRGGKVDIVPGRPR